MIKEIPREAKLSPLVELTSVSTEDYRDTEDMCMYYSGTYLVKYMVNSRRYSYVYVQGATYNKDDELSFEYITPSGRTYVRPCTEFYTSIPDTQFVIHEGQLYLVGIPQIRGYKKGLSLNSDCIKRHSRGNDFTSTSLMTHDLLQILNRTLYPSLSESGMCIVSPRIAIKEDRVISALNTTLVGKYKDGVLYTHSEALIARIEEMNHPALGDIKCQLIQL